jgi:HSP20 family protein
MNRLIEQSLSRSRSYTQTEFEGGTWAELPEVDQEAIRLRIVDNRITIKGERRLKEAVSQKQFHRTERAFGPFSRTFSLPSNIDPDKVKAELKRGVLKVTMQKQADELSKQIPIDS